MENLRLLEIEFDNVFKKQQSKNIINKPLKEPILIHNNANTLMNIVKEIESIDIENILIQLREDEEQIIYYNNISDNIDKLSNDLNIKNSELILLTTSD